MDKEREAFNEWVVKHPDSLDLTRYEKDIMFDAWQAAKAESHKSASLYQWEINNLAAANQQWRDYAAKAQAVSEGFVLVPKEPSDAMLFAASGRDIVAEHYGGENILWPELRETWKAMIEAQEPDND